MSEQLVATVVAAGSVIRGEIHCAGDLVVHGRIEGAVSCAGELRLEAGGTIEAAVRARSVWLAGRLRGDVNVIEAAELAASCRLVGDLRAARVAIAPGAAVRGRVELGDVGGEDDDGAWGDGASDSDSEELGAPEVGRAASGEPSLPDGPSGGIDAANDASDPAHESETDSEARVERAGPGPDSPALAAAPAVASPRGSPPPMPASALALGLRSSVVLRSNSGQ